MENNSDRMGFALIALSVVAFVLMAVNGPLKSTVGGFFNGFNNWQTQTFNGINESNKQDVTHTAYSWSSDGTDRFTTTKPNLNLLNGSTKYTKNNPKTVSSSASDGVFFVSDVSVQNLKAGTYTMSGNADAPWVNHNPNTDSIRKGHVGLWLVSTTPGLDVNINLGDTVPKTINVPKDGDYCVRVNTYSNGTDVVTHSFWNFKLEQGSTATPYMPSASEVKPSDQPKYIGIYTDKNDSASQDPAKYTWKLNPDYHE